MDRRDIRGIYRDIGNVGDFLPRRLSRLTRKRPTWKLNWTWFEERGRRKQRQIDCLLIPRREDWEKYTYMRSHYTLLSGWSLPEKILLLRAGSCKATGV